MGEWVLEESGRVSLLYFGGEKIRCEKGRQEIGLGSEKTRDAYYAKSCISEKRYVT